MMTKKAKGKFNWRRFGKISAIVVGVLVVLGIIIPLPIYVETPGAADSLTSYIKVNNKPAKVDGKYLITSVYLQKVTGLGALISLMNPHATLMSEATANSGTTAENSAKINQIYMNSAVNEAKVNAFRASGISYQRLYNGLYVMGIQDDSHFKADLKVGDMITAINGKHFSSAKGFQDYIRRQKVGTKITINYQRGNTKKVARQKTVALAGTKNLAGIGIMLADAVDVTADTQVSANMGDIGGPSGGLMFSLQMYDALDKDLNLAKGRTIAGTGTIDNEGNVGEIGGIDKKVIVARDAGAKIFFAPYLKPTKENLKYEENGQTNYQEAKATAAKYAPKLKVVPVKNFKEAVNYLETH